MYNKMCLEKIYNMLKQFEHFDWVPFPHLLPFTGLTARRAYPKLFLVCVYDEDYTIESGLVLISGDAIVDLLNNFGTETGKRNALLFEEAAEMLLL